MLYSLSDEYFGEWHKADAMEAAGEFHGGQTSELYALSSSGKTANPLGLLYEVEECQRDFKAGKYDDEDETVEEKLNILKGYADALIAEVEEEAYHKLKALSRSELVHILESHGFKVYDRETTVELKEALKDNVLDGTLELEDLSVPRGLFPEANVETNADIFGWDEHDEKKILNLGYGDDQAKRLSERLKKLGIKHKVENENGHYYFYFGSTKDAGKADLLDDEVRKEREAEQRKTNGSHSKKAEIQKAIDAFKYSLSNIDKHEYGSKEEIELQNKPFELALKAGWDAEQDEEFWRYALKANSEEILEFGLECFQKWAKARPEALAENMKDIRRELLEKELGKSGIDKIKRSGMTLEEFHEWQEQEGSSLVNEDEIIKAWKKYKNLNNYKKEKKEEKGPYTHKDISSSLGQAKFVPYKGEEFSCDICGEKSSGCAECEGTVCAKCHKNLSVHQIQ